jgi:hypothetical protein
LALFGILGAPRSVIAHATAATGACGRTVARTHETGQAVPVTTPTTLSLLRLEVGDLRQRQKRQRFDTVVHLGRLGGRHRTCTVPLADRAVLDPGTRTDVVSRLLEAEPVSAGPASVWLSRAGEPQVQDDDLAWLSAAGRAFGALDRRLDGFWVVTRTGWLDVRTGESRTWKRLRL